MNTTMLTREDCQKILDSTESGAKIAKYKIEKFSNQTIGFLGGHFRLTIQTAARTTFTYFVKALPQGNQNQCDYIKAMGVFDKEVLLYKNLLSEMLKFAHFAPKCHLTKPHQCIVLEDLSTKGFRMCDSGFLDSKRCDSLLKTLAKFHASSLIYEESKSANYGLEFRIPHKFSREIKESTFSFVEGHPRFKWTGTCVKCLSDLFKIEAPEEAEALSKKLHDFAFGRIPELIEPSRAFRNVVIHDDLWLNNMLFNSSDDCVLVDFQLARYVPPVVDVLQALYMCLDSQVLQENFQVLLDKYFGYLSGELKEHKCENALTKDEFWRSLDQYRLLSLVESAMYATIVYISEELSDLILSDMDRFNEFTFENRSKYILRHYQENEAFRNRIGHVLRPLIDELRKVE